MTAEATAHAETRGAARADAASRTAPARMPALLASLALAAGPCLAALCGAGHLAGLPLSAAQMPTDRPVHIVQIGDSHTAGDAITGALRDALQARLGNGGRGPHCVRGPPVRVVVRG